MEQYIKKSALENIPHKLWKEDTGFENIDIARIAYNRALQDVQCEMDALEVQEEPVSEELEDFAKRQADEFAEREYEVDSYDRGCLSKGYYWGFKAGEFRGRQFEVPVSEDLKKAAKQYSFYIPTQCEATETWKKETEQHFKDGAKWKNKNLWKPADGDDLPEIGKEVVAFQEDFPSLLKIVVAHRPNPEGYDGKSLATGEVEHYTPKTYGKGGWNIPDVKWWLDCNMDSIFKRNNENNKNNKR